MIRSRHVGWIRVLRRSGATAMLGVAMLLTGCDDESGPGTLQASLELDTGGSPGAALLAVQGTGVTSVEGTGGTQSWSAPSPGGGEGVRVLLMDPDPNGAMTFEVEVQDLDAPRPTVTVFQAAGRDNERLSDAEDVRVIFEP